MEKILIHFLHSYEKATRCSPSEEITSIVERFISLVKEQLIHPYTFSHYHLAEHSPFNFYDFALKMVRPLVDWNRSYILGEEHLEGIISKLQQGENVVLLANHQSEIDPQAINLLVSPFSYELASSMTFVAGHRVTTDPLAVPFARGTNMLCIYSKRYIEHPPEQKAEKLQHNTKTLSQLDTLLNEGGSCIYIAPSGGRDRFDKNNNPKIAPFDPQSVELFRLLAQKAKQPTHFHLLALSTIHLLPPPKSVTVELGELREVSFSPIRLSFGPSLDLDVLSTSSNKKVQRKERSAWMSAEIEKMHENLTKE
jgi:glycerol-3-phosphate O-acyltransferase